MTLTEAIRNGLEDNDLESCVQDFIAQGFSAAMLTNPEATDVLDRLFKRITRKESDHAQPETHAS